MRRLHIDLETFSSVNLKTRGLYVYSESPDFEIMLLSYAFDDEPVKTFDLTNYEHPPKEFFAALSDPSVVKIAFNAAFERAALRAHYGIYCDPSQYRDTMILGLTLGLPGSLGAQAKVLKMPVQKNIDVGKKFINFFCKPVKPTKRNGQRVRNRPEHDPVLWQQGIEYNASDVEVERALYKRLVKYDQDCTWPAWAMDQRMNDRGILADMELVESAIWMNEIVKAELTAEAQQLTGLTNPNSVQQLLSWLNNAETEEESWLVMLAGDDTIIIENKLDNLRKKTVAAILGTEALTPTVRRVLELRQLMAKASIAKYKKIKLTVCKDGRVRGLYQFYGAARTGRWAGRFVQFQNLPQNHLKDLAMIRRLVKERKLGHLKLMFGDGILSVLSELIRTAFIPPKGKRFIAVDFKAIEARLSAWDTQEEWRLEVFRTHGLIYEASASMMFKVPLEDVKKGGSKEILRQKGKVGELAFGFGGGVNAAINMGALEGKDAMHESELQPLVYDWRDASPKFKKTWYATGDDATDAIKRKRVIERDRYGFDFNHGTLFQVLPSGRKIAYPNACMKFDKNFGRDSIVFDGVNQYTHQWGEIRTWGGKLFQNRIQAGAADLIITASLRIEAEFPELVGLVHDEAIIEVDEDWMVHPSVEDPKKSAGVIYVEELMCEPHPAYPGLPIAADGADLTFYRK